MRARGAAPPVSEAELHGFVDGGLEHGRRDAVSAFLAASPADAARVDTWRRQNEAIRAAFAPIPAPPLPWSWSQSQTRGAGGLAERICPVGRISWREQWSGPLIGLAFAGGVLLTACADYFTNHAGPAEPDALLAAGKSEAFTAQAVSALKAFEPPSAAPRLSPSGAQPVAAPILPALPAAGQTLAGVRSMPGEQGQMLCMFYTRKTYGTIMLCAEKTPGPVAAAPRASGDYPSAAITWRQSGANYALAGALPEAELRALADAVRVQVDAFDRKE
jgi:anti-sigma factor RsiW